MLWRQAIGYGSSTLNMLTLFASMLHRNAKLTTNGAKA